MSAPRRHLPALGAMERNDCTTCALSTMATGALGCDHVLVADPDSRVSLWRGSVATLGADGFPTAPAITPCPGWSPAWGSE